MIRLLFVDDEPNLLRAVERMLRPRADQWDMTFVQSGPEALTMLAEGPFEVVVSDMRMPEMDGATLLQHVRRDYPDTIRIIFSGQSSRAETLKAVSPAHQFIAKPCSAEELMGIIDQTLSLRSTIQSPLITELVTGIDSLPSLPELYAALTEELNRPEPRMDVVASIIERDPGMMANILKLVNSAFFGLRRRVSDARQAISLLGIDTITVLVLTKGIFEQFDPAALHGISLEAVWAHSTSTARIASEIAKSDGAQACICQDAFTSGMLHNVGKLVMASDVSLLADPADVPHGEVGAYLLGLWGLPDPIVEAIAFHETPSRSSTPTVDALTYLHVASRWATSLDVDCEDGCIAGIDLSYVDRVASRERLGQWCAIAAGLVSGAVDEGEELSPVNG